MATISYTYAGSTTVRCTITFTYNITENDTSKTITVTQYSATGLSGTVPPSDYSQGTTLEEGIITALVNQNHSFVVDGTVVATASGINRTVALSGSKTIPKTQSAQTKVVSIVTRNTVEASTNVSVSAMTSYAVTYNPNGGQGSIANQTKWYDTDIELSNGAGFARSLHTLTGWNTKADGTGNAYALGATYQTNSALALFAQWHLDYVYPSLDLTAYRVDSHGQPADDGEYIYITFDWVEGYYNAYLDSTITVAINNVTKATINTTTATGTWSNTYSPYSKDSAYLVTVTITDTYQSVTQVAEISTAIYPIDLYGSGTDVFMGIMHPYQSGQLVTVPELYVGSADNNTAHPTQGNVHIYLDETASSGTDYNIITALQALGWWNDVN